MIHFKPVSAFLYSASVVIALSGFILLYLVFAPVQVLKDWKISVPNQEYTPGSTIYITSYYTKVRDVSGSSKRYLQCYKPNSTDWDGYIPLTESDANRPKITNGKSVTAIAIPIDVPALPNTCRIYINVVYQINPFREYEQFNYSNTFKIEQGKTTSNQQAQIQPQETIQPVQPMVTLTPENTDFQNQQAPSVVEDSPPTTTQNVGPLKIVTGLIDGIKRISGL
jgi:hypothetical protein